MAAVLAFACGRLGCDMAFRSRGQLTDHHNSRVHDNNKTKVCDFSGCGAAFVDASALSSHKKTHSTFRWTCPYCVRRGFPRRDHLRRHALSKLVDGAFKKPSCPPLSTQWEKGNLVVDRFGQPSDFDARLEPQDRDSKAATKALRRSPPARPPVPAQEPQNVGPDPTFPAEQQPLPPLPPVSVPTLSSAQQPLVPPTGYQNLDPALPVLGPLQDPFPYGQNVWVGAPMQQNFSTDQYVAPIPQADYFGQEVDFDMLTVAPPMPGDFAAAPPPQLCVNTQAMWVSRPLGSSSSNCSLRSSQTNASSQPSNEHIDPQLQQNEPFDNEVEAPPPNFFEDAIHGMDMDMAMDVVSGMGVGTETGMGDQLLQWYSSGGIAL